MPKSGRPRFIPPPAPTNTLLFRILQAFVNSCGKMSHINTFIYVYMHDSIPSIKKLLSCSRRGHKGLNRNTLNIILDYTRQGGYYFHSKCTLIPMALSGMLDGSTKSGKESEKDT